MNPLTSVRNSWDAQCPLPTIGFRYLHRPHRRWKVAARRHPIPDLVQVPSSASFRSPQSSRSSTPAAPWFAFTRLYASQTSHLEIQNGFASLIGLLPLLVGSLNSGSMTQPPSLHPLIRDFIATTRCSASETPHPYSRPHGCFHLWLLRLHRSLRFPRSARPPLWQAQATSHAGCRSARKQVSSELLPQ